MFLGKVFELFEWSFDIFEFFCLGFDCHDCHEIVSERIGFGGSSEGFGCLRVALNSLECPSQVFELASGMSSEVFEIAL